MWLFAAVLWYMMFTSIFLSFVSFLQSKQRHSALDSREFYRIGNFHYFIDKTNNCLIETIITVPCIVGSCFWVVQTMFPLSCKKKKAVSIVGLHCKTKSGRVLWTNYIYICWKKVCHLHTMTCYVAWKHTQPFWGLWCCSFIWMNLLLRWWQICEKTTCTNSSFPLVFPGKCTFTRITVLKETDIYCYNNVFFSIKLVFQINIQTRMVWGRLLTCLLR